MLRIFLQLCVLFFLFGCNEIDQKGNTEIITDSYFFQKNSFNVNLYECDNVQTPLNSSYLSTAEYKQFIRFSEISERDIPMKNCRHKYFILEELTPSNGKNLEDSFFIEISPCFSLKSQEEIKTSLQPYLNIIKDKNIQVWSALSTVENNAFLWVNVWPSEIYREDFLKDWLSNSASGSLSIELRQTATCEIPNTYSFIY